MENRGKAGNQHYRRVRSLGKPGSTHESKSSGRCAEFKQGYPVPSLLRSNDFNPVTEACGELGAVVERWIG